MWAWDTPRRRVTPEAGYNLEEAHHTGWKPELAVLVKAMWPAKAGYHNLTCGGKEYRNIACRDRIPQSDLRRQRIPQYSLQRQNTTIWPAEARIPQPERPRSL